MNSASARDCLLHLARAKLSEREDLVQLNDKFVDIIEHVHYMEAEHSALEHDYNLLRTGIQSDSSGINEIFESEIRNVRVGIDEVNRNRQQLLNEQTNLSQQVKEAEQLWRKTANAALGVPKDVDEDFMRICQIKYEDCLTKRRIKYMEEKNRLLKQNAGRIFEQINLMRMRKDQAVSLKQEYILRKNELLNSIRNLEEDNKKIIMNEHKYFVRDRNADRHVFRDQLRQAIADIRADYEFKRVKNEEEIRVRLEREVHRINSNPSVSITWDRLKEELIAVKTNFSGLQQQVSQVEIRNAMLTQQIELHRLEISENQHSFEITLDAKIKEIEKMREQCTKISVELERLCDLQIDLEKEIRTYRQLLDQSGSITVHGPSAASLAAALNRPPSIQQRQETKTVTNTTQIATEYTGHTEYTPRTTQPSLPAQPYQERPIGYSPYQSSSSHSPKSVIDNYTYRPVPLPSIPVVSAPRTPLPASPISSRTPIPIPEPPSIPLPPTPLPPTPLPRIPVVESTYRPYYTTDSQSRTESVYDKIHSGPGSYIGQRVGHRTSEGVDYRPGSGHGSIGQTEFGQYSSTTIRDRGLISNFPPLQPINEVIEGRVYSPYGHGSGERRYPGSRHTHDHSVSSSHIDTNLHFDRYSPAPQPSKPEAVPTYVEKTVEESTSSDSVDEDNFQRFTRWYKGRVKITDVTPDFVQLVNRSSKKSADIGGFKLIHEFGPGKSVYVILPTGLILNPKDSLKIYARTAHHEYGSVVAEIDLFDTTIHTNTSLRNTNNEVKSWFVYTSNTEIGDADHHHH
uniref:IF rod domain-containing protein n=1 Tax=Caenorhabditis tropicalis TaxID=1561998 RepID=A0A1I7TZZ2_9PELO